MGSAMAAFGVLAILVGCGEAGLLCNDDGLLAATRCGPNGDLETRQTLQAIAEHILSTLTGIAVTLRRRRPIHISWL